MCVYAQIIYNLQIDDFEEALWDLVSLHCMKSPRYVETVVVLRLQPTNLRVSRPRLANLKLDGVTAFVLALKQYNYSLGRFGYAAISR